METNQEIAKVLAPEDVQPGMYVAVLSVLGEYVRPQCDGESWKGRGDVLRIRWLPWEQNEPMKVIAVCLPFVLVKTAAPDSETWMPTREGRRQTRSIDVRRYRLAQLSEEYGRKAFKRLKPRPTADAAAPGEQA